MGIASALALFISKKPESPWEVVDSRHVEPVPVFDEDDGACYIYAMHGILDATRL